MCHNHQSQVKLIKANNSVAETISDVLGIKINGDNISIHFLFEPETVLTGFKVQEIDCMNNVITLKELEKHPTI